MLAVEVLATTAGCAKEQKEGMDEGRMSFDESGCAATFDLQVQYPPF